MEYYSAIKNNDFRKFASKWMELENIILSEVTQSQKNTQDSIHRQYEAQKEGRPKYGCFSASQKGE